MLQRYDFFLKQKNGLMKCQTVFVSEIIFYRATTTFCAGWLAIFTK